MAKNIWPNGKSFAFTIIDDPDFDDLIVMSVIYEFLYEIKIITTKTVWVYPSRDCTKSLCLLDKDYSDFILDIKSLGYEIGMHGVGSGNFVQDEIVDGVEIFKDIVGNYPTLHTNHSSNKSNLYSGYNRFSIPLQKVLKMLSNERRSYGEIKYSGYFWGDIAKQHIKYMRSNLISNTNVMKHNKNIPYVDKQKLKCSNYWFDTCKGFSLKEFNSVINKNSIDRLARERGCCIISTNFSDGFLNRQGQIDDLFRANMEYISRMNGWFAPASQIFDYIIKNRGNIKSLSNMQLLARDARYFLNKIFS